MFDRPIQTAPAVGASYSIDRTTLTRAFKRGALGQAAYRSADSILIDTSHEDFKIWLAAHEQQPRVKGRRRRNETQRD